ncbi:MAG: energy transducer TonB [Chitinophagaceae bacterium]
MKDPNQVLKSEFLDIVFNGKNKAYGAYYMEKTYTQRLWLAVGISAFLVALVFVTTAIVSKVKKPVVQPKPLVITFTNVANTPKRDIPPPPPPPAPKVKVTKFTDVNIVKDNEVQANERPVIRVQDIKGLIGKANVQGNDETVKFMPPPAAAVEGGGDIVFDAGGVEILAEKPREWEKFLRRTLRANIPTDNGAPVGTYRVLIEFVIERDGSISKIRSLSKCGYGMEEEAIRVLKLCPAWSPGLVSGKPVRSYFTQPITFEVTGE